MRDAAAAMRARQMNSAQLYEARFMFWAAVFPVPAGSMTPSGRDRPDPDQKDGPASSLRSTRLDGQEQALELVRMVVPLLFGQIALAR